MEHLTYTISRGITDGEWHLVRSDGMQLVRESWPCDFDLSKGDKPSIEPVSFSTEAQAERFVTLYKAGVPLHEIDYNLEAPSGVSSLSWAPS